MSNIYGRNLKSSPARAPSSPHNWTNPDVGSLYLGKLLEEKKNLASYVKGLPICNKLLNQEILMVSEMISNQGFNDFDTLQLGSPNLSDPFDMMPDVAATSLGCWDGNSGWSPLQHQGFGARHGLPIDHLNAVPASPSSSVTKKALRLDVPIDRFPNFNFIGRLIGPRGNSLKRIEAFTGCRVFIRGRGSMKDSDKEERLRGRPGYAHLNEPLHVLIEAELPASIVDAQLRQAQKIIEVLLQPMDKPWDLYKKQQLRELAMLRRREDSSQPSSSASRCSSDAMNRANTAW